MNAEPKTTLHIEGMTCNNCALGISRYLKKQGAKEVLVSFPNEEAIFEIPPEKSIDELVDGISKLGFEAIEQTPFGTHAPIEEKRFTLFSRLMICAVFSLPLLLAMILPYPFLKAPMVQLLLCLPVMFIGWSYFGLSAWHSLKIGILNMDVLIVIGSTAAFVYSVIGYIYQLGNDFLFFETAATIITLVLLGNWIEERSVKQTTSAIKALTALQPETARLIETSESGLQEIKYIPITDVKKGQLFLVNDGDKVPTDGVVVWGNAAIDESLMTGESQQVTKLEGSEVIGGSVLLGGSIKMKATKVGHDTTLAKIIDLVKQAQQEKPPIQRLADKISAIFVPLVLGIAALTFGLEYYVFDFTLQQALLNAIAVLVVACPCAMGLATPTAVMVGVGRAAQNGVLFKGARSMGVLKKIKNIVFDKTGTLTTGSFDVFNSETDIDRELFRSVLFSLEKHSTHPIAQSLLKVLEQLQVKPFHFEEVKEMKGLGIIGKDGQGNSWSVGSHKLVSGLTEDDKHDLYMLKNGKLIGWIDLDDRLKANAPATVRQLGEMGIETWVISGDVEDKTTAIAQQVGIQNFYANKVPEEKMNMIANLAKKGTIAMVGDGINDAPALAKADIGISLSDATDVAMQSADVILLNNDIGKLPFAIKLSRETTRTIKQNLFWAFFYNILMIPIAALGFLNPMIAAFAMAFSDVVVIGNSIRLRFRKIQ